MSNTTAHRIYVDATISNHARYAIKRPNASELEFHVLPFRECGGRESLILYGCCKAIEHITDLTARVEIMTPQHSIASLLKLLQADPLKVNFFTAFNSHARAAYSALLAAIGDRPVTFDKTDPNEEYIWNVLEAEGKKRLTAAA